jgi:hypothetical protein
MSLKTHFLKLCKEIVVKHLRNDLYETIIVMNQIFPKHFKIIRLSLIPF